MTTFSTVSGGILWAAIALLMAMAALEPVAFDGQGARLAAAAEARHA